MFKPNFNPHLRKSKVEEIRKRYPTGSRVELIEMEDPYTKIPKGTRGTVQAVDDIGSIHVKWDTGSSLAVIYGVDRCKIVKE